MAAPERYIKIPCIEVEREKAQRLAGDSDLRATKRFVSLFEKGAYICFPRANRRGGQRGELERRERMIRDIDEGAKSKGK